MPGWVTTLNERDLLTGASVTFRLDEIVLRSISGLKVIR